jgi:hypothetical protein
MNKLSFFLVVAFAVVGCDVIETISVTKTDDDTSVISTNAANGVSILKNRDSTNIVCIGPGPDALAGSQVQISNLMPGSGDEAASSNEAEMSGRTPTLLMMRHATFNLCNMYQNGVIDRAEYLSLHKKQFDTVSDLMAKELLNTSVTITETAARSAEASYFPIQTNANQTAATVVSQPQSTVDSQPQSVVQDCPAGQVLDSASGECVW